MPDWTRWLTEEERWRLATNGKYCQGRSAHACCDELPGFLRTVATLRALVEEMRGALKEARSVVLWAGSTVGTASQKLNNEQGRHEKRILAQIDAALALTEDEMRERQ